MPTVPPIVGKTVAQAKALPPFATGVLKLKTDPLGAPATARINGQDPDAGTQIDVGGTVTAIVQSQTSGASH